MSSAFSYAKDERTFSDPEDKEIGRNLFKERSAVPTAGHRMISHPYRVQARHPNFDEV